MTISDHFIYRLASDLSASDTKLLAEIIKIIENPPETDEEIGFYGVKNRPAQYRIILAAITLLDDRGVIYSIEDKYLPELLANWIDEGVLTLAELPPEARSVFAPMIDGSLYDEDAKDPLGAYIETLEAQYAIATKQLEEYFAKKDLMLLSIDVVDGDTLFFAIVPTDIGKQWRNRKLSDEGVYEPAVRAPLWDSFWHHLVYALQLPTIGDTYTRPLPAGVPKRGELLPLDR